MIIILFFYKLNYAAQKSLFDYVKYQIRNKYYEHM